jgi:prepilin-type N-terminal cleavage/methylation domain-containing protein
MRLDTERGFTIVEVLVSLAVLLVAAAPMLWLGAAAQRLSRSQAEAGDLQQRARVLAEKLQRDLVMAGAGPPHGSGLRLADLLAPIVPARIGLRLADPELSAHADRISILYVPSDGWESSLAGAMPTLLSGVPINTSAGGCPAAGLCGFTEGTRTLIADTRAPGAGFDLFTVTAGAAVNELGHGAPNLPFSQAYAAPWARVMPIVQRTYWFDRAGRRLMMYDGHQSDMPLLDNVVDLRFSYFAAAVPGPGLRPLSLAELSDGPPLGLPPNRFDVDATSIRIVRVTIVLAAAADDSVPDFEITFDVAPRNLRRAP